MNSKTAGVVICLLVAASCNVPPEVGVRYRAERELWRADREVRRLSIQPKLVNSEDWKALAIRLEGIATDYTVPPRQDDGPAGKAVLETRQIAARSLISAATVHAMVGDSTKMMQDYERVASGFQDLPLLTGEVALARGRIAEAQRNWAQAAHNYQTVLDRVPPNSDEVGVASAVVGLPMQIARLQSRDNPEGANGFYTTARERYQHWIATQPGTRLEIESWQRLADLAADRAEWSTGIDCLRRMETLLIAHPARDKDPALVRLGIARLQARADTTGATSDKTLTSLLEDYPKSPVAPEALLALAAEAGRHDRVDAALVYLDRVHKDYPGAAESVALSLLMRGRLLEEQGRWQEALQAFKSLPAEQPMSDAALQAPLEIAAHYDRVQDAAATKTALADAEKQYRDILARYPPGPFAIAARSKLAQTLALQKRYDEAVSELVSVGESLGGTGQGAEYMVYAARIAATDLNDKLRAAEILDRTGMLYPDSEVGRWAGSEASRLRQGTTR